MLTVRQPDGTVHAFQASPRIEGVLDQGPIRGRGLAWPSAGPYDELLEPWSSSPAPSI